MNRETAERRASAARPSGVVRTVPAQAKSCSAGLAHWAMGLCVFGRVWRNTARALTTTLKSHVTEPQKRIKNSAKSIGRTMDGLIGTA